MVTHPSLKDHLAIQELYKDPQKISDKIQQRRTTLAGHCACHKEEKANERGRRRVNDIEKLLKGTGAINTQQLWTLKCDRIVWCKTTNSGVPLVDFDDNGDGTVRAI